jgi:pilus assembly protein CpaE
VAREDVREPGQQGKRGEMIVVCSAKGGIGRTVMAVNLAVALSKNNRLQIGLMDGDFQFGDVCLAMDLHPTFTIKDVIEDVGGMDSFALSGFLMHHSSGVKVLAAPERPEQADLLDSEVIGRVCDLLLSQMDYLIVDTAVGLTERTLQLIDKADQVFVLTTLEMASIKSTKLMLETLSLLGSREKATVVVNRSTMESVIKAQDVPNILDEDTPVYVPNDFQVCSPSLNIGIPFVLNQGKTDIAKSIFRMAEQLISRREIALFKPKQASLVQSLLHRAKSSVSLF